MNGICFVREEDIQKNAIENQSILRKRGKYITALSQLSISSEFHPTLSPALEPSDGEGSQSPPRTLWYPMKSSNFSIPSDHHEERPFSPVAEGAITASARCCTLGRVFRYLRRTIINSSARFPQVSPTHNNQIIGLSPLDELQSSQ
jgi:hypothetical protein